MNLARLSPTARRRLVLGAWLVATALVVAAFRAVGWRATTEALRHASVPWLAAAVLANLALIALWAWQSLVFLPPIHRRSFGRLLEVTALTTTATNTAPVFVGEAAGVALLAERGGVGAAAAISVFAQHHAAEGIAKVAMLLAAARVAPLPRWMHDALVALTVAAAVIAAVLGAFALSSRGSAARGRVGRLGRAGAFVRGWTARLGSLWSPGRFAVGVLIALLMKSAEASGWLAVERAFAVSPAPGSPILALAAVSVASAVSLSPGNVGVYEAAAYVAYTSVGVPRETALALAVAGHLCYLLPLVGAGYVLLSVAEVRALGVRR